LHLAFPGSVIICNQALLLIMWFRLKPGHYLNDAKNRPVYETLWLRCATAKPAGINGNFSQLCKCGNQRPGMLPSPALPGNSSHTQLLSSSQSVALFALSSPGSSARRYPEELHTLAKI
jgi:hypothetical protein